MKTACWNGVSSERYTLKSLIERAAYEFGGYEHGRAGAIGLGLVLAGRFVRPGLHDLGVPAFQKALELGEGFR